VKKRTQETQKNRECADNAKKQKTDCRSQEERLKASTIPLWNIPYEKQVSLRITLHMNYSQEHALVETVNKVMWNFLFNLPQRFNSFHWYFSSHAVAQMVGCQLFLMEFKVQCQVRPCGICNRPSGTGTCFSLSTLVLPVIVIPQMLPTHIFIYHRYCVI
jgi:hypothetical protein